MINLQKEICKWVLKPDLTAHEVPFRAAIQKRDSTLAWIVILSVYGADTIAIDLTLSALIS